MFHAHTSEFAELGWMGFFNVKVSYGCDCAISSDLPNRSLLSAITPLVLLAGLIWWFFHGGSQLIERTVPPIEEISIRRVEL